MSTRRGETYNKGKGKDQLAEDSWSMMMMRIEDEEAFFFSSFMSLGLMCLFHYDTSVVHMCVEYNYVYVGI